MMLWRKIVALCLLLPFLFSVTGVLIFHSHCRCTGKDSVGLYVMPEGCESLLASHKHLFEHHAGDLNPACMTGLSPSENEPHKDCGCESPQVKFFKLKSQFTDEKEVVIVGFFSCHELVLMYEPYVPLLNKPVLPDAFRDSPPSIPEKSGLIRFICQSKIPDLI